MRIRRDRRGAPAGGDERGHYGRQRCSGRAHHTNPTIRVVSEKGSGAKFKITVGTGGDYPAAVGYFEQRRCFAGMANDPQRIVMTRSGTEDDFSYSLPTRDDDRISQQIAVNEFNDIRHLVSLSQLLLMTAGAEVRISPLNSDALTPSSFSRASSELRRVLHRAPGHGEQQCDLRGGPRRARA